jgi:hypothetical protein
MPKTTIKLPNGTVITVEGAIEDVERIVAVANGASSVIQDGDKKPNLKKDGKATLAKQTAASTAAPKIDLMAIVHLAKTCDESDAIAKHVLDKRAVVNRVLLPLYLIHEHKSNSFGLTSGEISKVLKELGTPLTQANTSTYLSGDARAYVIGDKTRIKGQPVRYKIIRRGVQHIKDLLKSTK